MKKTNSAIAFLSLLALALIAAHIYSPQPVSAQVAMKDRDYQVVTAPVQTGGDGLYILDIRTGKVAIFTYDLTSKSVRARVVRDVADIFAPR